MSLPFLPLLQKGLEPETLEENIELIYSYLQDMLDEFSNAVGQALDPTEGEGGDSSVPISDIPTGITYVPGSGLSVDGTLFGHIDITYVKPRFAVRVVVRYREQGVSNFSTIRDEESPFRLSNLKVGSTYELQIAGQSVTGAVGPYSILEVVTIPTSGSFAKAPADALYWVGATHTQLSAEIVPSGEATVVSVVPTTGVIGIEVSGITTSKRQVVNQQTQAITLTGTNVAVEILTQEFTVTHNLNKICLVTVSLDSIANETATARFISWDVKDNGVNSFVVRIVGIFILSLVNVTATAKAVYW